MKVRFLEDEVVHAQDVIVERFKAGQVVELSDASARHWLSRNKAEVFMNKAEEKKAVVEQAPVEEGGAAHPTVAKLAAQKPAKAPKKRRFGSED